MAQCEMCGNSAERLISGIVEGVELKVCNECIKLGERKKEKKPLRSPRNRQFTRQDENQLEERVLMNAGKLIKSYREKKGMRQQDLAKMLQIKDSQLHHIEIGDMPLKVELARRIQGAIGVTLIKQYKHVDFQDDSEKQGSGLTLGDLIKVKK